MAEVIALLGRGGQRFAETMLGWNRPTIRKGQIELETGIEFIDCFSDRGRKRAEHYLPELGENHFWFSSISKRSSPDEKANDAN